MSFEDFVGESMKFKFDSNLDYQLEAIDAVVSLFNGQNTESGLYTDKLIFPNQMNLNDERLLENLREIQKNNDIQISENLDGKDFSVEMETGTGKTYVYLRTIMELNKNYGFKKFIIIITSIAIKEGVLKTLEITKEHFKEIYNEPYRFYEYDSSKLGKIKQFARDNTLEIMVMTIDSFNKDTNIMNNIHDRLDGQKPIDLVSSTRPILILDEPQNMESPKNKEAIKKLNPLFNLRYSATHRNYYNLLYRLTPVDAYNKGLVKKIVVSSIIKDNDFNRAYIKCVDIKQDTRGIKAVLEVNKKYAQGLKKAKITVKHGDILQEKTNLPEYEDFDVTEIDLLDKFIIFRNGAKLTLGEDVGGDRRKLMKTQISKTIKEHFKKQQKMKPLGIKVLSLFFIDRVSNYMDEDGFIRKTFENEFERLKHEFEDFKMLNSKEVQGYYFSKYKPVNYMENDKEIFDKIMRDKEALLSFEEPIQFIFSHSALNEGWDNPNVFNICTLNETVSNIKKRQEIGRGVRLPVNQHGDRIKDTEFLLHVIANERYVDYVSTLQNEFIDEFGNKTKFVKPLNPRKRKTVKLKKGYELKPEFKELWAKISKKTKYCLNINTEKLIKECVEEINTIQPNSIKIMVEDVILSIESEEKISTSYVHMASEAVDDDFPIPNLVNRIANETNLTRKTVFRILSGIDNLNLIFTNPQEFILSSSKIINNKLKDLLVNGVKYIEIDDWWQVELFQNIVSYEERIVPVEKSIYDSIIFDSEPEKIFAQDLDELPFIKLFIKLPWWFIVRTPIGDYNPDWAIVIEVPDENGETKQRLYFVSETKFNTDIHNLRPSEQMKIAYATEHFKSIGTDYMLFEGKEDLINYFHSKID